MGQVEGTGQTHLRCEQGSVSKHYLVEAEQDSLSQFAKPALPCSQHPLAHVA